MKRLSVTMTTDSSGDATSYVGDGVLHGNIHAIRYVKDDFADGVDVAITGNTSGIAILSVTNMNATATYFPRYATCDETGVASLYAGSGEPVEDRIPIANELIKIVVSSGGDKKSGTFHIWVE